MSVDGDPDLTSSNVENLMKNLILNKEEVNTVDESLCPLDKLANVLDVAYIVISQLEYIDLLNLACVNKKWFRTIVHAPKKVKPVITVHGFNMREGRVCSYTEYKTVDERGQSKVRNYYLNLDMNNFFNMIKEVKVETKGLEILSEGTPEISYGNMIKAVMGKL